ncbi:MAG: SprB repeat-containing protein [Bacteroidia bacterium]
MRKILSTSAVLTAALLFLTSLSLNAQQLNAELSNYRGVNVSCFGSTDGAINLVLPVNPGLCTYLWSNGAVTEDINNLSAGTYSVTVNISGSPTLNGSWTIAGPEVIGVDANLSEYGNFNVSSFGADDGEIVLSPYGGVAPYTILWSNGGSGSVISRLTSGNYTATITDANGCTLVENFTLTEPSLLEITNVSFSNYNGFHVSCPGTRDGWIEVNVNGGVPPYSFNWSNGNSTNLLDSVGEGIYTLEIYDANENRVETVFTLSSPERISSDYSTSTFPSGNSVSCYNCFNGYIKLNPSGGVGGFQYAWSNNATSDSIYNLGAGVYSFTITDQNQCEVSESIELIQPERDDWRVNGNTNVNSTAQFMGTLDTSSLVMKTNNVERLRIGGNGEVSLKNFIGNGNGWIYADSTGVLKKNIGPNPPSLIWQTNGNTVSSGEFIGTLNDEDLVFKTNDFVRGKFLKDGTFDLDGRVNFSNDPMGLNDYFQVKPDPIVFSGTKKLMVIDPGTLPVVDYGLVLKTSITNSIDYIPFSVFKPDAAGCGTGVGQTVFRINNDGFVEALDIKVFPIGWCDYVFKSDYPILSLDKRRTWIKENGHLPGMHSEQEVAQKGISVQEMFQLQLKQIEELNLYIFQLEDRLQSLEKLIKKGN